MNKTIFSVISILGGAYLMIYSFFYLMKGGIRTPSIWDKKPILFNKNPKLAFAISIVQIILGIFLILLPLMVHFMR